MSAHDWTRQANCIGYPIEVFFPRGNRTPEYAMQACSACPVRQQCLDEAMREEKRSYATYGIRGGLTARQRDQLRKVVRR